MEDIIIVIGPTWAWICAVVFLLGLGGLFGYALCWVLDVRPLRRHFERDTVPVSVPIIPRRPKTDTLVSHV